jgi:hypothetical protein
MLVEGEQLGAPAVTGLERESEVSFSEPAETLGPPDAEQPAPEIAQADFSLKVPPILLEGDEPPSPPMSGPGQKYVLGPAPPAGQLGHEEAALPEAYGTGKLVLAARDPHWLYAQWDLTPQQQQQSNALSADRHLVVRVYPGKVVERPIREVHVHPESRHWFIHVDRAETQYIAELGYYLPERQWVGVSTSAPTVTPAETVSTDQTVRFATIPAHVRLSQLAALVRATVPADLPPMEAARELALAELVGRQLMQQDWSSSAEVGELVRGRGEQEISAGQMVQPAPAGREAGSVSSPSGAPEQSFTGFWFNVNAEVVIYGATEPEASVRIGSRPIELRPDGTFSCRFSLPDGEHVVTLSALSAQGDLRQAELRFSRRTECRGEVGAAPPDQSLETPEAESA